MVHSTAFANVLLEPLLSGGLVQLAGSDYAPCLAAVDATGADFDSAIAALEKQAP